MNFHETLALKLRKQARHGLAGGANHVSNFFVSENQLRSRVAVIVILVRGQIQQEASQLSFRRPRESKVANLAIGGMIDIAECLRDPQTHLAMRPHNTGHWTIEGARTSQFEQHLRAVLDLPLGSPALAAPAAAMANVLGGDDADVYDRYIHVMAADPAVKVHMYGKQVRPGRKIGHVTVVGEDPEDLADRARRAASYLRWGKEDGD